MKRVDFAKGIKILEMTYNQKFDDEKLNFWYRQLLDLDKDIYFNNIKQIIKNSQFMPNIAQIRNKKIDSRFQQRDYSEMDFNKFYANFQRIEV